MSAPSAAELIAEANAATTSEELDAIEAEAEGRVTVINAVHDRRDVLARQSEAQGADMSDTPVVDASPTQQPITVNAQTLEEALAAYPAPASPPEVLELEPNSYAKAVSGPDPQIDPNTWVTMTKPDGTDCLVPLANVPYYEWKGYTKGAEQQIENINAYWDEKSGKAPAAAEPSQ